MRFLDVLLILALCVPLVSGTLETCPKQVPKIIEIGNRTFHQYRECGEKERTILLSHFHDEPVVYSSNRFTIFSTKDSDFRIYDTPNFTTTLIFGTLGVIIFLSILGFGVRVLCP